MSRSKPILHSLLDKISNRTLRITNKYTLHSLVPQNYRLADIAGLTLSSLMLLLSTLVFLTATCILSLWYVMILTWEKLTELWENIDLWELKHRFTSCLSAVRVTRTSKTADKSQNSLYNKDTGIPHVSTLTSSAMPGELDPEDRFRKGGVI